MPANFDDSDKLIKFIKANDLTNWNNYFTKWTSFLNNMKTVIKEKSIKP